MNEQENDREGHDDRVDELKALKPRAPQLNWDAIRSAHSTQESILLQSASVPVASPAHIRPAVAWWSGLAAGAAITFFTMQWLVLNDLRAQLHQLEQTAKTTSPKSPHFPDAVERPTRGTESTVDIHTLLDEPRLSVGSYRGRENRWVYSHSDSSRIERSLRAASKNPSQSTDTDSRSVEDLEVSPPESSANQLLLLRDLQRVVF